MIKKLLIFFLFFLVPVVNAQDSITLEDCQQALANYYPLLKKDPLLRSQLDITLKQLNTNYFPSLDLIGKATYQSDVVSIDVPLPNVEIPSPSKDQYSVALEVGQTIYDGGITQERKALERTKTSLEQQQLQVNLHALHERVNDLYLNALLIQEREEITTLTMNLLQERVKVAQTGYENGVVLKADLQDLKAEKLKLQQAVTEIEYERKALLAALAQFTGMKILSGQKLSKPESKEQKQVLNRPEIQLFDLNRDMFAANSDMLTASRRPKLGGFAQVGYGKPGLNMLADEFDTYYLVGARLSWNVFDWNQTKMEKEKLSVQTSMVDVQEETFRTQLQASQVQLLARQEKLSRLIEFDDAIIILKKEVVETASKRFDNGEIRSVDLLSKINELDQARQNKSLHEIQRIKTSIELNTLFGNY